MEECSVWIVCSTYYTFYFFPFFTHNAFHTAHNQMAYWRQRSWWRGLRHFSYKQGHTLRRRRTVSAIGVFEHMPQAPGYVRACLHNFSSIEVPLKGNCIVYPFDLSFCWYESNIFFFKHTTIWNFDYVFVASHFYCYSASCLDYFLVSPSWLVVVYWEAYLIYNADIKA